MFIFVLFHFQLFIHRIKFLLELRQVLVVEPIEVMHTALLVEKAIGGVACQSYILLNGVLLVGGQVIVNAIGLCEIVLSDDVLPRLLRRTVSQIEIHDVVVLEFGLEFV